MHWDLTLGIDPERRPCPFCGGATMIRKATDGEVWYMVHRKRDDACPVPRVGASYQTREQAQAAWALDLRGS